MGKTSSKSVRHLGCRSHTRRPLKGLLWTAILLVGFGFASPRPLYADDGGGDDGGGDSGGGGGENETDRDGDGIDDSVDLDDDNDGFSDADEIASGTDSRDSNSKPGGTADLDHDGLGDDRDTDDDNDGVSDIDEVAAGTSPRDSSSHPGDTGDSDGDGSPDTEDADDDNDGISDSLENEIGTSPRDSKSTPFGSSAAQGTQALDVSAVSVKLNFVPKDTISLSGTIPVSGTSLSGKKVIVDVGGVAIGFTLNAQGSGKNGASSIRLSKPVSGISTYTVKLAKGQFAGRLADEGLIDADVSGTVQLRVSILTDNIIYQTTTSQQYTAKKDKSGQTK